MSHEIKISVYTARELKQFFPAAFKKAHDAFLSHAFDYPWYESTYEDAEQIGAKIESFDVYRNAIEFKCTGTAGETIRDIIEQHGACCDTYKFALDYYRGRRAAKQYRKHREGMPVEPHTVESVQQKLGRCYLKMLSSEAERMETEEYFIQESEETERFFEANGHKRPADETPVQIQIVP